MLALIVLLLLQPPDPASGQAADPDPEEAARLEAEEAEAAQAAQEARAQAAAFADEITALQARLVEAGRRAEAGEQAALDAEGEIARLDAEETDILARLEADRESLTQILAALQRIERQAPPALLATPEDSADAARAAALMAEIVSALQERAEALSVQLEQLRLVRAARETERERLGEAEGVILSQREQITALIAERRALEARARTRADDYARAAAEAGDRARTIRGLISELRRMREISPGLNPRRIVPDRDIPAPRLRPERGLVAAIAPTAPLETLRFSDARGQLRPPAAGQVVRGFGQRGDDGVASEGIVIRTRARAQVVSPFDGTVDFAEPYGAYGGLLILNVGDGYYVVLAGMAALFATSGQSVLAGEPVGAMPDRSEPAPELILEVRRGDDAIDPRPWLRTGR
jgi:septal ring factor EnvC (AmiA/AmiB activator)